MWKGAEEQTKENWKNTENGIKSLACSAIFSFLLQLHFTLCSALFVLNSVPVSVVFHSTPHSIRSSFREITLLSVIIHNFLLSSLSHIFLFSFDFFLSIHIILVVVCYCYCCSRQFSSFQRTDFSRFLIFIDTKYGFVTIFCLTFLYSNWILLLFGLWWGELLPQHVHSPPIVVSLPFCLTVCLPVDLITECGIKSLLHLQID